MWNVLKWMPQNTFDDESTLVQIMVWRRQARSHYLIQCWPDLWHHMAPLGHNELTRATLYHNGVDVSDGNCTRRCFLTCSGKKDREISSSAAYAYQRHIITILVNGSTLKRQQAIFSTRWRHAGNYLNFFPTKTHTLTKWFVQHKYKIHVPCQTQ